MYSTLASVGILAGGVLSGYTGKMELKEKVGILTAGYSINAINVLGNQKLPLNPNIVPALFVAVPFVLGSAFCMGSLLGSAGKRV